MPTDMKKIKIKLHCYECGEVIKKNEEYITLEVYDSPSMRHPRPSIYISKIISATITEFPVKRRFTMNNGRFPISRLPHL